MEFLYTCLLLLFSSALGVPTTDRRSLIRLAKTVTDMGGYDGGYGIFGGKPADIGKYPHTVSLMDANYSYIIGGGAILNKHWIVCSAFELLGYTAEEITLRAASNKVDSGGQLLHASKIISHEKFNFGYPYDVAVIKTKEPIKLSAKAKPVKIANTVPKRGKAEVTGFGKTTVSDDELGQLQVATVEVKSQSECHKVYTSIGDTCLCADADDAGPCYYDIGDPLVKNKRLVGWFLGGDYCNIYKKLDIYANAAELRKWIQSKIRNNSNKDEMEGIDDDDFYRSFDDDEDNIQE